MEKKYRHKVTGDEITYKDGVIKTNSFTLEIGCEPSEQYWEEVIEVISPFLITEDGVELYDGDSFVWQTHDYKNRTKASIQNPDFLEQVQVKYAKSIKHCKFFRDKNKAQEYILFNKPCLSIEDLKTINHANNEIFAIKVNKLEELVKSKSL